MACQLISLSIGCILLFLGGLVKADEIKNNEDKAKAQLYSDVYILKQGVDTLQMNVELLVNRSISQIDMLTDIQSNTENQGSNDGVCDRISGFFNSTLRKYNTFEERIITKLEEIQAEQSTSLELILVKQNLAKNCQQGSALDIMSSTLSEINEKIDKFEKQLQGFESLEQKLKEQQDKFQALNDAQLKILNDINEKLTQSQLKFENFEKQMPSLKDLTENIQKLSLPNKAKLPMDIILGLTQRKPETTTA